MPKNKATNKQMVVAAVSGGFDPVHSGHIRMFKRARSLGDRLVVILNNDNWLLKKKKYIFMPEQERKEVLESIRYVDEVFITSHKPNTDDMTVCQALLKLKPDIFANGGDRPKKTHPPEEVAICAKIGCKMVFNVGEGGKIQSSSQLVDNALKAAPRKISIQIKKK